MEDLTGKPTHSLTLLAGMVDRPRATLAAVLARPRWKWLLPALLCLAAAALALLVSAEALSQQAAQQQAAARQRLGTDAGLCPHLPAGARGASRAAGQAFAGPVMASVKWFALAGR